MSRLLKGAVALHWVQVVFFAIAALAFLGEQLGGTPSLTGWLSGLFYLGVLGFTIVIAVRVHRGKSRRGAILLQGTMAVIFGISTVYVLISAIDGTEAVTTVLVLAAVTAVPLAAFVLLNLQNDRETKT
ncbi:hypothetical protein AB0K48_08395 [Nonomuraea sp. NPDC055795]